MGATWDDQVPTGRRTVRHEHEEALLRRLADNLARSAVLVGRAEHERIRTARLQARAARILSAAESSLLRDLDRHLAEHRSTPTRHGAGPLAVLQRGPADPGSPLDDVVRARFPHVIAVTGTVPTLAQVALDRPDLVVLEDADGATALATGLLVRALAPTAAVILLTRERRAPAASTRLGFVRCSPAVDPDLFGALIDELAA